MPGRGGKLDPTTLTLIRASTGEFVPEELTPSRILATSADLGWQGVIAEIGRERDWEANDLTFGGHLIAMNMDSRPMVIEHKNRGRFTRITCPPGSLWINPAGQPFTRRYPGRIFYGAVELSPETTNRILGHGVELQYECGTLDEPLAAVVRSLLVEASTHGASGPLFAEAVSVAIAWRLARRFGRVDADMARGALQSRLKTVFERIEDTLGSSLSIEALAAEAGLSPAHFSREFRRLTGWTPHAFVMNRRLHRARAMVARGESVADTAFACGFSDQPHLARLFKATFGITPKAFVRSVRKNRGR
jgi:AraC family transcriptional regulator